jgi:chromosome partitioning protein
MLITVGAEKGGVGKSTIVENLGALRASKGRRVLLVDLDAQQTTAKWTAVRTVSGIKPEMLCIPRGKDLARDLVALREQFDTVLVDIGGKDTSDFREAMVLADRVIVPLKPSPADLSTVPDFATMIRRVNTAIEDTKDVAVVLNMVDSTSNQYKRFLAGFDPFRDVLRVLDGRIHDRVAFQKAYEEGKGVHELASKDYDPKAAVEIDNLYTEIFGNE